MFQQLATAVGVITGLMMAWVAVQALKRRSDPRFKRGDDVLAGCGTCSMADGCHPDAIPEACEDKRRVSGKE